MLLITDDGVVVRKEVSINAQDIENYGFGGGRNGDTVAKFDGGNIYLGNDGGS